MDGLTELPAPRIIGFDEMPAGLPIGRACGACGVPATCVITYQTEMNGGVLVVYLPTCDVHKDEVPSGTR